MKKRFIILSVLILSILSGCANADSKESSQTSNESEINKSLDKKAVLNSNEEEIMEANPTMNVPKELYHITGKQRDNEKYIIKDNFKVVFPAGKITRIFGSTLGVREKQFSMTEQELKEIISVFEQDAIAYPDAYTSDEATRKKSEHLMPETEREETYGQIILEIETASKKKHDLYLMIHADDVIHGVSYPVPEDGGDVSFGVKSTKIAKKLRSLINFKVIDRSILEQAVSAKCTSIFNNNTVTITGERLQEMVAGIQQSDNIIPPGMYSEYESAVATLEILLDNGEVVHGLFRGHGYHGEVAIEAEQLQASLKSTRYLQALFEENDIPQKSPYYNIRNTCQYVDPANYSQTKPTKRDEKYFLSYAEAASYETTIRLEGTQRDDQKILWNKKQKKLTLPEGMIINTTTNRADGEKVKAIPSEDEVHQFIEILESAEVRKIPPEVWSDELNIVTLDTAGDYSILLFSLNDSYFNYENEKWVNCMVLSENNKNHGRSFRIKSDELYNFVASYVNAQ